MATCVAQPEFEEIGISYSVTEALIDFPTGLCVALFHHPITTVIQPCTSDSATSYKFNHHLSRSWL